MMTAYLRFVGISGKDVRGARSTPTTCAKISNVGSFRIWKSINGDDAATTIGLTEQ
jgi:hypothetical protein